MPVYLGIDWSQAHHALCFLSERGGVLARLTIAHAASGFPHIDTVRQKLGVAPSDCWVGLETAHTLLIDWLWSRGYTQVFVIPPNVVRRSRERYRQTGAHTDASDAYVIADLLRTDQARLQPWFPDSPLIRQLRASVSFWLHLTQTLTRTSNRLRAVLERYYPVALHVFSSPMPPVGLHFVVAHPTPDVAARLDWPAFAAFARAHHNRQSELTLRRCYARLQAPYPTADPAVVAAYADEAVVLADQVLQLHHQKQALSQRMATLFAQHPDARLFESLPGTGPFLAAALLAKFGDDRRRFPTAAVLQALAGACPVTEQSGKRKVIKFRQACDREFRYIVQQWAMASVVRSVWAATYWEEVRPRSRSAAHAYRCVANRWLAIAWKVWQSKEPYDEARHLQRHALRVHARREEVLVQR